jgi:hypothetical protein
MIYDIDYELVSSGLWMQLLRHGIRSSINGMTIALTVFVLMHYNPDGDKEQPQDVEELLQPICEVPIRIAVREPDRNYFHLSHFPRNIYLQEAIHMFLRGIGYQASKEWLFYFNYVDEHTGFSL